MSKIIAYACSTRPNALWSAAQFNSALPKNRIECDIPLVAESEANVFKAKSIARGKLLERFRCHVQNIVDNADNQGDLVVFGSTNDFEHLREMAQEMDDWNWDAVMRERVEIDPYAELRAQRARAEKAEAEIERLADKIEDLIAEFGDDPKAALECVAEHLSLRRHAALPTHPQTTR